MVVASKASTEAFDQILSHYSLRNEGEQSLDRFDKQHPILGTLFASPIKHELELPSHDESAKALNSDVRHLLKTVRGQSAVAAWWSCFLLSFSLVCVVTVIAVSRSFTARAVLFLLTCVALVFFFIGVIAPAMVIWTAPVIPMETGKLNFVVQHEVRGIAAIIWELLTSGHGIIGGFLLLFSIVTPLTKAALTFFVTASRSKRVNFKIGQLLHTIGKWSMADVFVAGVLLSLYALKFQQATKSIACLGLYYFIGYCLLSMLTTELLVHSEAVGGGEAAGSKEKLGGRAVAGLYAGVLCVILWAVFYTYEEHAPNLQENPGTPSSPQQLKEDDLPAHK